MIGHRAINCDLKFTQNNDASFNESANLSGRKIWVVKGSVSVEAETSVGKDFDVAGSDKGKFVVNNKRLHIS